MTNQNKNKDIAVLTAERMVEKGFIPPEYEKVMAEELRSELSRRVKAHAIEFAKMTVQCMTQGRTAQSPSRFVA
jgi:hypothetical protein